MILGICTKKYTSILKRCGKKGGGKKSCFSFNVVERRTDRWTNGKTDGPKDGYTYWHFKNWVALLLEFYNKLKLCNKNEDILFCKVLSVITKHFIKVHMHELKLGIQGKVNFGKFIIQQNQLLTKINLQAWI